MLAFLAMMIATSSALTQFASTLQVREEMVRSELEIMANAVALEAVELKAVPAGFAGIAAFDKREERAYMTVDSRSEPFTLRWTVRYMTSDGLPSTVATDIREVTVGVYNARYPAPLVEHTRLFGE